MAINETQTQSQSDVLRQLGVSYPQLIDYSSREDAAILVQIGLLALMAWDCIITFDGEIAFFWQAKRQLRWSLARILFMVNRHFPIIVFSLQTYWRVNRSLDNPLCNINKALAYIIAPVYITTGILQTLRVWSLYNRSRRVGLFLFVLVICVIIGTVLARTLPTPSGIHMAQLAPDSLTGCGHEQPKGFFACTSALVMETVLLTMIISKVYRSWKHVGPMPIVQALVMDGATYYVIFILTFSLEIVANTSDILYYPIVDTNLVICVTVVACNHLVLSLKEAASRPTSTEPLSISHSLSRRTTSVILVSQASGVTDSYDDRSQTISLAERDASTNWKQSDVEQKAGTSYETQSSSGSTARVSFEMD